MEGDSLLALLAGLKVNALYGDAWAAKGVLRILPPIPRSYVLRLLREGSGLNSTFVGPSAAKHEEAVAIMRDVGILQSNDRLNEQFRHSLERALMKSESLPFREHPGGVADEADVDKTAFRTWERVLNFLVVGGAAESNGSIARGRDSIDMPLPRVQKLLRGMNLVSELNEITGSGYGFILKDVYTQVRLVLQAYIMELESPDEMLTVLFKLSFTPRGKYFSGISGDDLGLLCDLGVVVPHPRVHDVFSVSSIGCNAFFGTVSTLVDEAQPKHRLQSMEIIVETTFRLYCYTESPLHERMLRHFVSLEAILPNLVVGSLTRASVTSALAKGITPNQIIDFLTQNAHPEAKSRPQIVPSNVRDQIVLWDKDCKRVKVSPGFLLYGFASTETFDAMLQFAQTRGFVLWSDRIGKRLFVSQEGSDAVRDFAKELRAARRSGGAPG